MTYLTAGQLLDRLLLLKASDPEFADLPIILRIQDDDALTTVGELFAADIESGCTDHEALILDGSTDTDGSRFPLADNDNESDDASHPTAEI